MAGYERIVGAPRGRMGIFLIMFAAGSALWSTAVWGQNATTFQLNLTPPGARSLAMGGAFVGLADDATAAYTNPAGLTSLTTGGPEIAVELRNWQYSSLHLKSGRFSGQPTGIGLDTSPGPSIFEAKSETSGLSFLSAAYVFPHAFVVSVYRHQLVNFATSGSVDGYFAGELSPQCAADRDRCIELLCVRYPQLCPIKRSSPIVYRNELRVTALGVAAAHEIELPGELGHLSLGLALPRYTSDFFSEVNYYSVKNYADVRQDGALFGPPDLEGDNLVLVGRQAETGESHTGLNAGLIWRFGPEKSWSIGAVYRKGVRFRLNGSLQAGPAYEAASSGTYLGPVGHETLHIPGSTGIGVAYSAHQGRTKVTTDYDVVRFSQRLDDYYSRTDPRRGDFRIHDAQEIHLGLEQVFLRVDPLFVGTLRLGAWREGAHDLEYRGADPAMQRELPSGKDQMHYSGGFGFVIKEDFQIDVAAELSDRANIISVSLVRFF